MSPEDVGPHLVRVGGRGAAITSISRRLRRLISDAQRAGLALVADADCQAVRIMSQDELRGSDDLRTVGVTVTVHGGCGGGIMPQRDASGNG